MQRAVEAEHEQKLAKVLENLRELDAARQQALAEAADARSAAAQEVPAAAPPHHRHHMARRPRCNLSCAPQRSTWARCRSGLRFVCDGSASP